MPYRAEISASRPACFLLLVDHSQAMAQRCPPAEGVPETTVAERVCRAVNEILLDLVVRSARGNRVVNLFDVAVIGYTTSADGEPMVRSLAPEPLGNRAIVSISQWAEHPREILVEECSIPDEETGQMMCCPLHRPVWVQPEAVRGAPRCAALKHCTDLLAEWVGVHPRSFPPIVIHHTASESSDGDAAAAADGLRSLATDDGPLLLFHSYWTAASPSPIVFPGTTAGLPDPTSRQLFAQASDLPEFLADVTRNGGHTAGRGARGIAVNHDLRFLLRFLDIGMRS